MNVILDNSLVKSLTDKNNYSDAAKELFELQKQQWQQLATGYETLKTVKTKTFQFEGFKIKAQFNAGRIISTSAKVDPKSIQQRRCFLCVENLPAEQKGILYRNEYLILCNPFPIFPEHFTLTHKLHQPQRIIDTFSSLLDFSKDLSKYYSVIYNGPRCGASAPDHLHFQAGNKYFMTIDNEFHQIKNEYGQAIFEDDCLSVFAIDDGLRKFISIESIDKARVENAFSRIYKIYAELMNEELEPLLNIASFYDAEYGWRVLVFLRSKHRPAIFFLQDESKMLVSPASIDIGGVCIFPREEDYDLITKEKMESIFKEVFIEREKLNQLVKNLSDDLPKHL